MNTTVNPSVQVGGLRSWLQLMRLPAVFTAISNIVAAQLIGTAGRLDWSVLSLLVLASCALYLGGMVLNDCFDLAVDLRERPTRPLPSGKVPVRAAWISGWALLIAGILIAGLVGTTSLLIAALLATAIVLYDAVLKSTALGAPNMGLCRYLNWLLGFSATAIDPAALKIALPVFIYVTSLTLISSVESGGESRRPLIIAGVGMIAAGAVIGWLYYDGLLSGILVLPLTGAALLFLLYRLEQVRRRFSPGNVQQLVGFLIFGIIPLDALLVLGAALPWAGLAILLLMIPGRWLGRWMYIT